MRTLAIITARGGSKRIPHKNIKEFLGKPILAYSIEAALKSDCFDEVMVSTDDEKIAQIALRYGAKLPFLRSSETANDFASTKDVVLEVLEKYKEIGEEFEAVCCIYPTAPFLTPGRLREAMELLAQKQADSVIPVVAYSFPPQRCLVIREEKAEFLHPEYMLTRSQDLESYYHDCGQFYCLKTDSFRQQQVLVMKNTYPIILSEMEVQDIDTLSDWKLAELKYKLMQEKDSDMED